MQTTSDQPLCDFHLKHSKMQFSEPHQNDNNKSDQQENEYHRVDYRQPMNLQEKATHINGR